MEVTEILPFDDYWNDERFRVKRPNLDGSLKWGFGDNIYHRGTSDQWLMVNSHHSLYDGTANPLNIEIDTKSERVLVSTNFTYWGGQGPPMPAQFEDLVCQGRNHRCNFPQDLVNGFIEWLKLQERGYLGRPLEWIEGRALRPKGRS
jgi:Nucleotide modification associated domain 2